MDGTSERELHKALKTYLNCTGAGDYNIRKLIGEKMIETSKKNAPSFSFASKTKMSWFPEHHVDFLGKSSPAATKYSPKGDRYSKNASYSVGKVKRFQIPSSIETLHKNVPHHYQTLDEGLVTGNYKSYGVKGAGIGYGSKADFTNQKETQNVPGPIYNHHETMSMANESLRKKTVTQNGFFNGFDKYDKICYSGMEKHYYLRETQGPGAYLN
jgi:hypothetical protein